jgi:hypothetical protein
MSAKTPREYDSLRRDRSGSGTWVSTIGGLLLTFGVAAAALAACSGGGDGVGTGGTGATGGAGGGGPPPPPDPYELFLKIEPKLVQTCGLCHKEGGSADAPFIAGTSPEERYASITAWPGIVIGEPDQSILMTHPDLPTHGGGEAPPMPPDVKPGVIEWLQAEAQSLPENTAEIGPSVKPFRPLLGGAFNTIYLGGLGPEFEYMSISFNADAIGGTTAEPTMLWVTNITVHTVAALPLHIVHPLFTVYSPGKPADPDPVDSFSNIDQTFTIDGDQQLGTGELVLTNWKKGAYLGIAFEIIEVYGGNAGAGTGCKDILSFTTNVVPAMQTCMMKCHGGTNPQAKGTMDLSELAVMPPEAACIEVRARINPAEPDKSQILQVTNPIENVVHMYKFEGDTNAYNAFKAQVTPWITAEQ